jgi:putative redox protein
MMESNSISATAVTGETNYKTSLQARTHTVWADEPETDGGRDTAPKPGEYLCMSLAACTAITLQMYAGRKQWDVGSITVKVTRIMEEKQTKFESEVSFSKQLEQDVLDRLIIIAQKCPVHKILTHPIHIETKLVT